MEPSWVPGLPIQLRAKNKDLLSQWQTLYAVLASRISRVRCTLITMDSNMRIDADDLYKLFKPQVAEGLERLSKQVRKSLEVVAKYVASPYDSCDGWKGNISALDEIKSEKDMLLENIQQFAEIITHITKTTAHLSTGELATLTDQADVDINHDEYGNYHDVKQPGHKARFGATTMAWWHQSFPMRSFCNLAIQSALQTASLLNETILFCASIRHNDSHDSVSNTSIAATNYSTHSDNSKSGTEHSDYLTINVVEPDPETPCGATCAPVTTENDKNNENVKSEVEMTEHVRIKVYESVLQERVVLDDENNAYVGAEQKNNCHENPV